MTKLSAIAKDRILNHLCLFSPAIWLKMQRLQRTLRFVLVDDGLRQMVTRVCDKLQINVARGDDLPALCQAGEAEIVWLYMLHGHQANKRDNEGATLLQRATHAGTIPILALLQERGASVNAKGTYGYTPLHEACYLGNTPAVQFLLHVKANVDALSKSGSTPLLVASREGHASVVKALLAGQADADDGGDKGWTPLAVAAGEGHEYVCQLLLEGRADVSGWPDGIPSGQPSEMTPTALELAERCGHAAVCNLLRQHGALEAMRDLCEQQALQQGINTTAVPASV